jgi:phosphoenolpyruvate-protein phosphotransferase
MELNGIGASAGIAVGRVFLYESKHIKPEEKTFPAEELTLQLYRLNKSLRAAGEELDTLAASLGETPQGKIIAAHCQIIEDEEIVGLARDMVTEEYKVPEYAVYAAFDEFIRLLEDTGDPIISARAADLHDIRERVLRVLTGAPKKSLAELSEPVIVVSYDLSPSDTLTMDRKNVLAIITETGSITSHTAIIACSLGLPAVLGIKDCVGILTDGETVAVDAVNGRVCSALTEQELFVWQERRAEYARQMEEERLYIDKPGRLADGTAIEIGLNIGNAQDNDSYRYADFIGLFRTEFLYMDGNHLPTEEEQYQAYKQVLEQADGKPVTLRTLDIGGDKQLPYFPLPKEENPFLGLRALRLCLAYPELLRTQLRAALRASVYGSLWIMFPMVGRLADFEMAKSIYEEEKVNLLAENIPVGREIKLGVMIEIPALALMAKQVAKAVDFASIGTNDLCQYLCAADRMNTEVADYYEMFSPGMVVLLRDVIRAFSQEGKPLSVCGEMAGHPQGCVLLAGLGLRKFSVGKSKLASVKAILAACHLSNIQRAAMLCCEAGSPKEIEKSLANITD